MAGVLLLQPAQGQAGHITGIRQVAGMEAPLYLGVQVAQQVVTLFQALERQALDPLLKVVPGLRLCGPQPFPRRPAALGLVGRVAAQAEVVKTVVEGTAARQDVVHLHGIDAVGQPVRGDAALRHGVAVGTFAARMAPQHVIGALPVLLPPQFIALHFPGADRFRALAQ